MGMKSGIGRLRSYICQAKSPGGVGVETLVLCHEKKTIK
jgi:hypothetical protein